MELRGESWGFVLNRGDMDLWQGCENWNPLRSVQIETYPTGSWEYAVTRLDAAKFDIR